MRQRGHPPSTGIQVAVGVGVTVKSAVTGGILSFSRGGVSEGDTHAVRNHFKEGSVKKAGTTRATVGVWGWG